MDGDRYLWISLSGICNRKIEVAFTNAGIYRNDYSHSFSVVQRKGSGEIWFGTYDGGIFAYHKGQRVRNLTPENCKFLGSSCVSALYEDKYANCWVGTRGSLGVQLADGNSFLFENMSFVDGAQLNWFYVRDIIADSDNSMWIATSNYGLIHIEGDIRNPSTLKYYNYSFIIKEC